VRALVAIDGTESSFHAAARARTLLPAGTTIVLATVVPPQIDPNEGAGGFAGPVMTEEEAEREHTGQIVAADAALAEAARAIGPEPLEQHVVEGSPHEALAELATQLGVDLIVLGSHAHGLLERAFLGSEEDAILRASPASVLMIPPPHA
jgi:nucleotide-binding universal stress UspA family protein